MPQVTDIFALNKINYLNACRVSDFGVKCYFMPVMTHAKLMLVDDEEGVIGSQNLDVLSFGLNMEAGIFFRQKDIINSLRHLINKWKNGAILFLPKDQKIFWWDHFLISIFKLFYPIF